jgi:hypothetical protein
VRGAAPVRSLLSRAMRALAFVAPQAAFSVLFFSIEFVRTFLHLLASSPLHAPHAAAPVVAVSPAAYQLGAQLFNDSGGGLGRAVGHAGPLGALVLLLAAFFALFGLGVAVVNVVAVVIASWLWAAVVGTLQGVMVGGWFDAASLHRQKDPSRPFAFKRAVGRAMLLPALLVPYIALCNRGHGVSGALFAGWQVATWSVVPVLPVALAVGWWRTRRLAA